MGSMYYDRHGQGPLPEGMTAHDYIQYERNVLGNSDIEINPKVNLKVIPSQYLHWMTRAEGQAHDEGLFGAVMQDPNFIAHDGKGSYLMYNPEVSSDSRKILAHHEDTEYSQEFRPTPGGNAGEKHMHVKLDPETQEFFKQLRQSRENENEVYQHGQRRPVNLDDPIDLKQHMIEAHGYYPEDGDFTRNNEWNQKALSAKGHGEVSYDDPDRDLTHPELHDIHSHEHEEYIGDWPNAMTLDSSHFHTASRKTAAPIANSHSESDSKEKKRHSSFETSHCKTCGGPIYKVDNGSLNPWVHDIDAGAGVTHQAEDINEKTAARKSKSKMTPEEREQVEFEGAQAKRWVANNRPSARNIIEAWNRTRPEERAAGMTWYEDTHRAAQHLADQTGVDVGTMAGLVSNYSPQMHWHTNMVVAAKVARTKQARGGKGDGVMASDKQKENARQILGGKHWSEIFKGPKTSAFAHLIEHGGNEDDSDPQVAIDRHAYSVAVGKRASDLQYSFSGLGAKRNYNRVASQYKTAARIISQRVGYEVKPHQLQAATWIAQQRHNSHADAIRGRESSVAKNAETALKGFNDYMGEHHPELLGMVPGTGHFISKKPDLPDDVKHSIDMAEQNGETVVEDTPKTASFFGFFQQ